MPTAVLSLYAIFTWGLASSDGGSGSGAKRCCQLDGNYSLRNILGQDGQITAVMDWLDAQYGDFVYDIATFDYWCGWMHVSERFQQYYQEQHREVPFYAERLLCYQCYHALGGLRFFAAKGDEQAYQITRAIILQKLKDFAG